MTIGAKVIKTNMETDRKDMDIVERFSTPRELCKTCIEWNESDIHDDFHDQYRCVAGRGGFDENRDYLLGYREDCPFYFEL